MVPACLFYLSTCGFQTQRYRQAEYSKIKTVRQTYGNCIIWRKKSLYLSKVSTIFPQILCLKHPASTYRAAVYEPASMSNPVSLNHQITLFSGHLYICSLWKGHMTPVGLRSPFSQNRSYSTRIVIFTHLRENTLNTSHIWPIMTLANQFSSPNWVAADFPQLGVNSFQRTAGASSRSCVFFSFLCPDMPALFMLCENLLCHSEALITPTLHDIGGTTLLYFSCFRDYLEYNRGATSYNAMQHIFPQSGHHLNRSL